MMAQDAAAWEHHIRTRLTALKLACALLDRQPGLSDSERRLVRTALEAADGLTADLIGRWEAERAQGSPLEPPGPCDEGGRGPPARRASSDRPGNIAAMGRRPRR